MLAQQGVNSGNSIFKWVDSKESKINLTTVKYLYLKSFTHQSPVSRLQSHFELLYKEPGTKISYQKSKGLKLWETLNTVARLDLNLTLALNILKTQDQIKLKNPLIQI